MPRRKRSINPPLSIYKKIALSFIILTIILIVIVFYFTLSYAYITIYPNQEEINTDFNFIIVEDETAQNPEEGIFPGKIVNQTVSGEKTFTTTGTKIVSEDIVGQVKLINNRSVDQPLVATTRLLAPDNTLFRIKNNVTVPANGDLLTEVYPDDSDKNEARALTKFTIPGLSESLQELVYAENPTSFVAEGEEVTAISQEELDKAVDDLAEELSQQIFSEEDAAKIKILSKKVVTSEFSNEVGEQVNDFTLVLNVEIVGVMFDNSQIKSYAQELLESIVSIDKDLIATNSDVLIYEIEKSDLDNKLAQLKSNISGIVIISEDSQILEKDKISNLNFDEIKAYLENFDDIDRVELGFFPGFLKKVPYFQDHIIIRIVQ